MLNTARFPFTAASAVVVSMLAPLEFAQAQVDAFQVEPERSFKSSPSLRLSGGELQVAAWRQGLLTSSSANSSQLTFELAEKQVATEHTPVEMIQSFRKLSGLTWAQLAGIFHVSSRSLFMWAEGRPISAGHQQALAQSLAALNFVDRGSDEDNRNLLLSDAGNGITYYQLLENSKYEEFTTLAGPGNKREPLIKKLSKEAEAHNAPKNLAVDFSGISEEILDQDSLRPEPTKLRRVKTRKMTG
ncbi:hypothetical protein [Falsigemmobacter faecalis]|uniref:Transcriptional regulator n=1 Tax=Falsigemmobacter faecalis TaxID=2488730 RepID=A0A3P3DSS5_9RHOB|nr:hypothetical protein [Falsigemmobacter faecalis]RRH76582.1 hypothetical protein EG244_05265 [Falsigemmobacter faecalis]